tara:strand:- start:24 stop:539 length:516 start_codon:yes stop_codon:yes gene_type:complete
MAITINGNGTVTGLADRGIPSTAISAGGVIQTVSSVQSSTITSTSHTAYTEILSGTITTTVANSKILVSGVIPVYINNPSSTVWTNAIYVELLEGSSRIAIYDHPGVQNGDTPGELSMCIPVQFLTGTKSDATSYTYKFRAKNVGSGDTAYYGRTTDSSSAWTRMLLQEIS